MFSLKLEARRIIREMTKCCEGLDVDMPFNEAIGTYSHSYDYSGSENKLLQVLVDSPEVASAFLGLLNKHKGTIINFHLINDAIYRAAIDKYGDNTLTDIMTT